VVDLVAAGFERVAEVDGMETTLSVAAHLLLCVQEKRRLEEVKIVHAKFKSIEETTESVSNSRQNGSWQASDQDSRVGCRRRW